MLVKLTPNQISSHWEFLKPTIAAALPPTTEASEEGMNKVLKNLLAGRMQAWVYADEEYKIKGSLTTTIINDVGTEQRNLLIYSIYAISVLSNEAWKEGLEEIRRFATANGCRKILAYTNLPVIEERVKAIGGRVEFKLVSIGV